MKTYKNLKSSGFVGSWGSIGEKHKPTKKEVDFILRNFEMIHEFVVHRNYVGKDNVPFEGCGCKAGMSVYYLHPLLLSIIGDVEYYVEYTDSKEDDVFVVCDDGEEGCRTLSIQVCGGCGEKFFITENVYCYDFQLRR